MNFSTCLLGDENVRTERLALFMTITGTSEYRIRPEGFETMVVLLLSGWADFNRHDPWIITVILDLDAGILAFTTACHSLSSQETIEHLMGHNNPMESRSRR
jgi:hypothetical protein